MRNFAPFKKSRSAFLEGIAFYDIVVGPRINLLKKRHVSEDPPLKMAPFQRHLESRDWQGSAWLESNVFSPPKELNLSKNWNLNQTMENRIC